MVLRPTPMSRVILIGLKDDQDRILSFLHDKGVVQVEAMSKEALQQMAPERAGEEQRQLAEEHLRFKAMVGALPPVPVTDRRRFPDIPSLLQAASRVRIDEDVRKAKREEDALLTDRKVLEDQLQLVQTYAFFPENLSILVARSVLSYFGEAELEQFGDFRAEVESLSDDVFFVEQAEPKRILFVVSVPRGKAEAFGRLAQKHAVKLVAVPALEGSPSQLAPQLNAQLAGIDRKLGALRAKLRGLSEKWYPTILPIEEQLQVEARKADLYGRMAGARSTFALEGFVPTPEVPRLRAELEQVTGSGTLLYDLPAGPGAPTLLKNPKGARYYEFFIRFFSLPQSGEIDPTLTFALVFPLFFGIMLSDVGYAGFILVVCLWMIWRIGNPKAGPTLVPRPLVKFLTKIMPAPAMKSLAKCLVPGCLVGIVLGVMFDAYFGFSLGQLTGGRFDFGPWAGTSGLPGPVNYLAKLLILAVYIGLAMVTLGEVFGLINAYFHQNWKHVTGKVCWVLIAWGLTLLGLSLVRHNYPGSWLITPNPLASGALSSFQVGLLGIVIVGIVGVIATEGFLAAVEVASIISHVLSFARLVGILLASVILAYVINLVAIVGTAGQPALVTQGVFSALMGIVLVFVIAIFNIVIGVFEPGIQGARLLYVEYFSKFYTGNGKAFKPFGGARSFTLPQHAPEAPVAKPRTAPARGPG